MEINDASNLLTRFTGERVLRKLEVSDLDGIVQVHIEAFRESLWTKLGNNVVKKYYEWQLTGPHPIVCADGIYINEDCTGFCIGGVFDGSTKGFISKNRLLLAEKVISKPWLFLDSKFRKGFNLGIRIHRKMYRQSRSVEFIGVMPAQGLPETEKPKSFGILAIAVSPRYQGYGIGKQLMDEAENKAISYGFAKMHLTVNTSNNQAIRFYKNLGWAKTREGQVWKGRMEKALPKPVEF